MKNKKKIKFDSFIQESMENIKNDRALASVLATDLLQYIQKSGEHAHESHGFVVSKYLEVLQRSNEQMVKLASIVQKANAATAKELSPDEKENIYDMLTDEQGDD